jgi:hypothetical protein
VDAVAQNNSEVSLNTNSGGNPWILFLAALGVTIASGVIVIIIKLRFLNHERSQSF